MPVLRITLTPQFAFRQAAGLSVPLCSCAVVELFRKISGLPNAERIPVGQYDHCGPGADHALTMRGSIRGP